MSNVPSNIVKYRGLDMETVDAVDAAVQQIAGGDFESIEVGENVFRVLPTPEGRNPVRVTAMHYVDAVPGLEKMVVFACPRVELKQSCVACAKAEELMKTGNPIDRERAYRIQAGLRVYMNVLNRKYPDRGPKVLVFGKQIWEQIKAIRKNARMGGDYTDPTENGFDLIIMREGTGKNDTKYTVAAARENTPLAASVEEINELIEGTKDLEQYVSPVIAEELLLQWGGGRQGLMQAPQQTRQAAPPGQLVQQARAAAQQQVGTVGAGVMQRRTAPTPAASAPNPAATAPAASAVSDAENVDDDFN